MFRKALTRYTRRTSVRTRSSYLHKVGCSPLLNDTVGDVIEQAANKWPDRTAITDRYQEKSLNYAELLQQADKLAVAFLESGLRNGDRIGIWCPNMVEWVVSLFAAARAGLISVAINPSYQKSEIEFCLKKVDVKALIIPEAYKTQQYYRMMTEIVPELNSSEAGKVRSKRLDKLETVITIGDKDLPGAFNYEKLIKSANGDTLSSKLTEKVTPESGSNIQFTSGTTGEPKAALLSHKALVNNGFFTGLRNQLDTAPLKICAQVPLFHVFGMVVTLLASALHGCNVVLTHPSYSPSKNLEAIFEEKCEVVFGTPTMHVDLMAQLRAKGTQAKTKLVLTGGASCPPILVKNIQKIIGAESVRSIYGLTETSAVCFQSMQDDKSEKVTESVGQLHDHLEAKVVNENGETVPFGTPGELYVRGYSIFMKYWDEPVKTASALQKDGWLGTGDQFVLNEDGYGNVVGRIKDLIIRGGENIYPKEIEDLINTHPDVLETQVFGVNDYRLGEEICATVRLREGAMISEKIVEQFCHEKIAAFKIPRFVRTLKEYPKTASGKVQKHKLKEMFESGKI